MFLFGGRRADGGDAFAVENMGGRAEVVEAEVVEAEVVEAEGGETDEMAIDIFCAWLMFGYKTTTERKQT